MELSNFKNDGKNYKVSFLLASL